MTLKHMAQSALDVQSACNLSGVVRSFAEIVHSMRADHDFDTPTCNTHPISRLFAEQIAHLTHAVTDDNGSYESAYRECERLSQVDRS